MTNASSRMHTCPAFDNQTLAWTAATAPCPDPPTSPDMTLLPPAEAEPTRGSRRPGRPEIQSTQQLWVVGFVLISKNRRLHPVFHPTHPLKSRLLPS